MAQDSDPARGQAAEPTAPAAADEPTDTDGPIDDDDDDYSDDYGDGDSDDADSAIGYSDSLLSTETLTSSILEYRELHGRTYAPDYWGPNDARQSEGLDLIHHALLMLLDNRLFLAPVDLMTQPGRRVLDVGTGTGIWALEVANEFPRADVYGTDLSPIQPLYVPPNLRFQVDDCLLEWTWPDDYFDLVHVRMLYGCVPDWTALDRRIWQHLRPGGWFEHVEIGCHGLSDHAALPPGHAFHAWARAFYAAGDAMGRPFTVCLPGRMAAHMRAAGFEAVHEVPCKLPVNGWPRAERLQKAGLLFQHALDRDLEGFSLFALTQVLGWTREAAARLVAEMRRAIRDTDICPYITTTVVYGRKPGGTPGEYY